MYAVDLIGRILRYVEMSFWIGYALVGVVGIIAVVIVVCQRATARIRGTAGEGTATEGGDFTADLNPDIDTLGQIT